MAIIKIYRSNHLFCALVLCLIVSISGCSGMREPGLHPAESSCESNASGGYRLQPGDQVSVQIYREPQLSGVFRVDAAGFIRHPLCGSFASAGRTLKEAEASLTQLLGDRYLVNPKVILAIESAQSSHVVLLGEVVKPGVHPVPFGESITLLRAIAEAGGFTDLASADRVTVTRTVDGKETSIRARVSRMIAGKEPDMPLKPNDVIMVPQVIF